MDVPRLLPYVVVSSSRVEFGVDAFSAAAYEFSPPVDGSIDWTAALAFDTFVPANFCVDVEFLFGNICPVNKSPPIWTIEPVMLEMNDCIFPKTSKSRRLLSVPPQSRLTAFVVCQFAKSLLSLFAMLL